MEKNTCVLHYGLTITSTENGEWQGWLENDEGMRPFRSVMQLLRLIRQDERKKKNLPED